MAADANRRVVMLVDNGVIGDSRVQKQAAAIAERGWEVVLVGVHRGSQRKRWRLGSARVVLVPVERRARPHVRSLRWRDPLAHPSLPVARYQSIERAGRLADERSHRHNNGDRSLLARLRGATLRFRSDLADLRLRRTEAAAEGRRTHAGAGDQLVAAAVRRATGDRSWRWLDPTLLDLEVALGPEIDRLRPDLIHANDFRMLGVAVRAKFRAAAAGRHLPVVWDAHEYLPGVHPWQSNARWHEAQLAHEREYAPHVDAVVTVSEELATMLQRDHRLAVPPTVVQNCPTTAPFDARAVPRAGRCLRSDCGLTDDVPLMIYSGSAREARGLDVMIEAMPMLPELHCALVVADPDSDYVTALRVRASALGVADRLHTVNYVPADEVVDYLAGADIGVIPILHFVNHEIALITKFFEYAHARLPIVVSDVRAMAAEVRATGIGEVFTAGDVASFSNAIEKVLTDRQKYRRVYRESELLEHWTWEAQADRLADLYRQVLRRTPTDGSA